MVRVSECSNREGLHLLGDDLESSLLVKAVQATDTQEWARATSPANTSSLPAQETRTDAVLDGGVLVASQVVGRQAIADGQGPRATVSNQICRMVMPYPERREPPSLRKKDALPQRETRGL